MVFPWSHLEDHFCVQYKIHPNPPKYVYEKQFSHKISTRNPSLVTQYVMRYVPKQVYTDVDILAVLELFSNPRLLP